MERFDSSALGSFPLSADRELVEHSMDNDESSASAVRKVSKTQKLEGKEYAASKLAEALRQRKFKSGHAKYWDQLAVDIVSMEENDDDYTETWRYDKVVVRCMVCGRKHDGATINVPNFAKSHFDEVDGVARCKTGAKQGAQSLLSTHNYFLQPYSCLHLCPLLVKRTDCSCQLSVTASCVVSLSWCTIAGKQLQQALAFASEDG
jgi:hypothetical protein